MALKHGVNNNKDENLRNWVMLNESAQSFTLVSFLNEAYPLHLFPQMWERHPKITVKPGRPVVIPHRYYKIHTRDDSPATFKEITMNEAVEEFAEKSLIRGEGLF